MTGDSIGSMFEGTGAFPVPRQKLLTVEETAARIHPTLTQSFVRTAIRRNEITAIKLVSVLFSVDNANDHTRVESTAQTTFHMLISNKVLKRAAVAAAVAGKT